MKYSEELWANRIAGRSDMSSQLVHLTRGAKVEGKKTGPVDVLFKILCDRRIDGSTTASGFVCGDRPASCFQDIPVYSVSQNVHFEELYRKEVPDAKVRYTGVGLMFPKPYIFRAGGRPVIYEDTDVAKEMLNEDEWWRIVKFDLSDKSHFVDWTHEREWRVPDKFDFDLDEATVLLSGPTAYARFLHLCKKRNKRSLLSEIRGMICLGGVFF